MRKKKAVVILMLVIALVLNVGCGEKTALNGLNPADFSTSDDIEEILEYVIDNEKMLNRLVEEMMKHYFVFEVKLSGNGEVIVDVDGWSPSISKEREQEVRGNKKLMTLVEDVLDEEFVHSVYRSAPGKKVVIGLTAPPTAPIIAMSRMLEYIESAVDKRNLIVGNWYYQELGLA